MYVFGFLNLSSFHLPVFLHLSFVTEKGKMMNKASSFIAYKKALQWFKTMENNFSMGMGWTSMDIFVLLFSLSGA